MWGLKSGLGDQGFVLLCYCSSPPLESEVMWKENVEEVLGRYQGPSKGTVWEHTVLEEPK